MKMDLSRAVFSISLSIAAVAAGETAARGTTVSGRLGQWLDIGGAVEAASRGASGILSASSSGSARTGRIWLKVDELRP